MATHVTDSQIQSEVRTVGFVFVSSVLHIALAIAVILFKIEQPPQKDIVEIQILGTPAITATAPAAAPVAALPKAAVLAAKPVAEKILPQKNSAPVVKTAPQKIVAVQPTQPVAETKATSPTAEELAAAPLETAELDEPKNISAQPTQALNTEDLNSALSQVDQESNVKVAAVQKNISADADSALQDQENETQKLKAQTAAENAALAQQVEKNKEQAHSQALALAKAEAARQAEAQAMAEKSAAAQVAAEDQTRADEIAKANAAQLAAAKLAAEKAAAQAAAAAEQAKKNAVAGEVRSLNELRQVPGNQHPAYDPEDRLKGRQGDVAFLAYISKEGQPVKFKILQSSGFRELDAKTLRAIQTWKFYPGQEGWVEIPFRWDLKGGPQEMPATLRRKISQF